MKHRNPKFGCVRIAQQFAHAFGIEVDKDVVRRVLAKHFRPEPGADGPSWLTLIAHAKASVWSVDLFDVEAVTIAGPKSLVAMSYVQKNTDAVQTVIFESFLPLLLQGRGAWAL